MEKNYKNILLVILFCIKKNSLFAIVNFDKEDITINNNFIITNNLFSYNSCNIKNTITVSDTILLNGNLTLNTNLISGQNQIIIIGNNTSNTNLFITGLEQKINNNGYYITSNENDNSLFLLPAVSTDSNKKSLTDTSQSINSLSTNSISSNQQSTVSIANTNINNENIDIIIGNKNNSITVEGKNIYLNSAINVNTIDTNIDMQKNSMQAYSFNNTNSITTNQGLIKSDITIIGKVEGYNFIFIGDGLGRANIPNIDFRANTIVFNKAILGNKDNTILYLMNLPIIKDNSYQYFCFDEKDNIGICDNLIIGNIISLNTNNLFANNLNIETTQNENIELNIGNQENNTYLTSKKIIFNMMAKNSTVAFNLSNISCPCYFDKVAVGRLCNNFFAELIIKKVLSPNLILTVKGAQGNPYSDFGTAYFSALEPISNFTSYLVYTSQIFPTYGNVSLLPKNFINIFEHESNLVNLDSKFINKNSTLIQTDNQSNIISGYVSILDLYKNLDKKKDILHKKNALIQKEEKENEKLKKKIEKKNNDIYKTVQIFLAILKKITDNEYKNTIIKELQDILKNQ